MDAYRDPDDRPVDLDTEDVATAPARQHPGSPLRSDYPDADRPAHLGDDDEPFVDALDDAFDQREFAIDSRG